MYDTPPMTRDEQDAYSQGFEAAFDGKCELFGNPYFSDDNNPNLAACWLDGYHQASAEPAPVPESPSPSPAHEIFNAVIAQELRVRETQAAIAVRAMAAVDALRDAVHAQIKPILPQLLGLSVARDFGTPAPLAKFNTPESMLHSKGLQVRLGFETRPIVLNLHLTRAEYALDEHTAQIAQMPQRNLLDRPRATLCIIRPHPEPTETVRTVVGGVDTAPELVKAFLEALAPYLVLPGGTEPRVRR